MSTTNGNMKTIKVTDKQGNVYILMPVDTEARQTIEEAKSLNFDEDYFTAEESEDEVNIGLNGVPVGVEENTPLMIAKDDDEGFVLTCKALFGNNFCSEYNATTGTYNLNDYTIYQGKIYRCIDPNGIGTAEEFTASKWKEVVFLDYDLNEAPLYSAIPYAIGKYCHHDGKLYKCTTTISSGETWNPAHWTEVERVIDGTLDSVTAWLTDYVTKSSITNEYSASGTYSVNDYCYYQGDLYRCISEANNEQWNANHWVSVSKLVADLTTLFNRTTSLDNDKAPVNHASQNTTYGIGTEDTIESGDTVYGNYGHVRISNETLNEYSTHEAGYAVGKGHRHSQYAIQSNISENYSAAGTYEIGDICYHDGSLYQCSTPITVAEEWNINHWGLLPIKLVDKLIKKSATTGLVKNDGTIDSTNYLADTDMYSGMGSNDDGPMTQKAVYDYLGSHWFINDTSGARWYELLTVNNPDTSNTGAGELFAVGIKDADGNYNQALLSITSYGPNNEIAAKLINLNSFDTSYSTKVQLLILRNYSSNYTLYAKLGGGATINNAVKIKPIMCTGTISIGDSFEVSEPSGSVAIDNVTNLFTTTNGGIGNQLQPVYVYKQGLVAPCNTANMVVALTDIGGPLDTGDTSSSIIVEDNILVTKTSADHPGNSINIQRLVLNKVYKVLFLTGTASDSQTMKLINFYENSVHNMEIYTSNSSVYNTPVYNMIATGSVHGASYTSHIMRTAQDTIYIIDGY